MISIFKKKPPPLKNVLLYGMGHDGSAPVLKALESCAGVRVRQVYTLDRKKVAQMMLGAKGDIPPHIRESDKILRHELSGAAPFFFITLVHEPFMRHIRHCFYQLQTRVHADVLTYQLANKGGMRAHFAKFPCAQTTAWFENEYLPATGINVFEKPFDHVRGAAEFTLGPHRFLLLSAHISPEEQTRIIAEFLGCALPEIEAENLFFKDLREMFMTQIFAGHAPEIHQNFWDSLLARHFFTPESLKEFEEQVEETASRISASSSFQKMLKIAGAAEGGKSVSARDMILATALSPALQATHVTAEVEALISKFGVDTATQTLESLLRQLERAKNNLVLGAVRGLSHKGLPKAVTLGADWVVPRPQDARLIKALATAEQKNSAIDRPLALLESLPERSEKLEQDVRNLQSQSRLLKTPFPFSPPRKKRLFAPVKKSILYNAHQALPFHTSGYATRTQGIVKGLQNAGWGMHVVTRAGYPADTGVDPGALAVYEVEGVPYAYDLQTGRGQWDLPLDEYIDKAADYLVERAHDLKPQILHTASNFICGLAGVEAARRIGVPSIYEMRGLWHVTRWSKDPAYADTDKFALAQKMELEAAHGADHVLAITGALKEWLVEHGVAADKISLAPNAVDLTQFQVCPPDADFAAEVGCSGKIVVGYIGSFVQYEGLDLLVQALTRLTPAQRENVRLLWIGDGPVLEELLEQARGLGVAECIVSLGRRPFEEIPRAYSIVDIAVFPRKGQVICEIVSPLKPFEAMAMEKAVIVSDVRPLKEIITHEVTGLVHRKDDAESLAEQLARFIEDEDLRRACGKAARAWIEQTRQWDIIAANVAEVYRASIV